VAIALVIVAVRAHAWGRASGLPSIDRAGGAKPLLVLGSFGAEPAAEQRDFYTLVLSRVLLGARAGTRAARGGAHFQDVLSFEQLADDAVLLKKLREIGPRYGRDMNDEIKGIQRLGRGTVTGYLRPTIRQFEDSVRVDLELYEAEVDNWRITRMKTVSGTRADRQAILDLVVDAARRIVQERDRDDGQSSGLPQPLATISPADTVMVGTQVTLDAGASTDPDHDTVLWFWCQLGVPEGARSVLSGSWVGRRTLEFVPTVEGEYRFALKVTEALGADLQDGRCQPDEPTALMVTVKARQPARALPGDSKLVELQPVPPPAGPAPAASDHASDRIVPLEGACLHCTQYRWRQTRGPSVALFDEGGHRCDESWLVTAPSKRQGEAPARCQFRATVPGEYAFELNARTELSQESKPVTVLVAAKPFVILGATELAATVDGPLLLEATASYDALDEKPRFRWEVLDADPGKADCRPSAAYHHGARAVDPTSRVTRFVARTPGTYYARVTMEARRTVAGRELSSYDCSSVQITVRPRLWTVFATGGMNLASILSNEQGAQQGVDGGADDRDEFFEARFGFNWMFTRAGRLGLRYEQAVYGYRLYEFKGHKPGGALGGGTSLSLSYTVEPNTTVHIRGFAGGFVHVLSLAQRLNRWGPVAGGDLVLDLGRGWGVVGILEGRLYRAQIDDEPRAQQRSVGELRFSGGLSYEF